ncbi:class I SAM-dependent methyltransferase [Streptacidiphilus neutrinimicus]|uniref:class I SAM-dependent methyltransferase n=1 Tax=Streptacidiphilus neutrinimicus TaxID=105420 RepID=UPI001269BB8E|nr:class I SAM-dependent methyltransferase [Streptacidiphilus neutrinimicus]
MIQDWEPYYRATADSPVRPLCLEAIAAAGGPRDRPTADVATHAAVVTSTDPAADPAADLAVDLAVDLGAGAGRESAALLDAGWRVLALDGAPGAHLRIQAAVPPARRNRLTVVEQSFGALDGLPAAGLIYAGYALPFQRPEVFTRTWGMIRAALRPGGILAVNLFGPRDTWASDPELTTHTPAEARALLDGLEILAMREEERDGNAVSGPKHWHVLDLVARA